MSAPPVELPVDASKPYHSRHTPESHIEMDTPDNGLSKCTDYFDLDEKVPSPDSICSEPLSIVIPPTPSTTTMAFSTLQYLPVPLLVLSSLKTVALANEALGRLLSLDRSALNIEKPDAMQTVTDKLRGQTMSELGIGMLQDGCPISVNWEVRQL